MAVMKNGTKAGLIAAVFVVVGLWVFQSGPNLEGEINTNKGVAIEGYDSVAYFKERAAVRGSSEFTFRWKDATWQFASAENRDLFANNPERWAPQYGGY